MANDLTSALGRVRMRIDAAAASAGRDPRTIELLLAVKTLTADRIREAIAAGGGLLGHNRAQELAATEPDLADLEHTTHFIGRLQSNKAAQVARLVSCVQSVASTHLAERLNRVRQAHDADPLGVMIQVNTSGEETKAGVHPREAGELAAVIARLPGLRLEGFMTIGANTADLERVRDSYDVLAAIRNEVVASGAPGTENARALSMGMSGDLEIAIAAGATMVRVGSAVFGGRPRV